MYDQATVISVIIEAPIVPSVKTRGRIFAAFGAALLIGLVVKPLPILAAEASGKASNTSASSVPSETANRVHIVAVRRDDAKDELDITLRIDPGYHINANPASFDYLIPTRLNFAGAKPLRVIYPAPVPFRPKFVNEEIAVYQGTVVITAFFAKGELRHLSLFGTTVTAQACTDVICFPPADLPVYFK